MPFFVRLFELSGPYHCEALAPFRPWHIPKETDPLTSRTTFALARDISSTSTFYMTTTSTATSTTTITLQRLNDMTTTPKTTLATSTATTTPTTLAGTQLLLQEKDTQLASMNTRVVGLSLTLAFVLLAIMGFYLARWLHRRSVQKHLAGKTAEPARYSPSVYSVQKPKRTWFGGKEKVVDQDGVEMI